jgi:uncharacterized lipoprotein YmbA
MKRLLPIMAALLLSGCAVPLTVKRLYVATWQSYFPPAATNTVSKR